MNDEDSPFGARDLTSSFAMDVENKTNAAEKPQFRGTERRHHSRRQSKDRRTDVRFEIDKPDRRYNHGRRIDDGVDVSR